MEIADIFASGDLTGVLLPALLLAVIVIVLLSISIVRERLKAGRSQDAAVRVVHIRETSKPVARSEPTKSPKQRRPAPTAKIKQPPRPFSGKVWVVDGDTIVVAKQRIRLFGMDAPELDQNGGLKAKSALIRLIGGKKVTIEPLKIDIYDRIVAKVWVGDADVSRCMVDDGFAVANGRWHRDYVAMERDARAAGRGLWAKDPINGITDPASHRAAQKPPNTPDGPRRPWLN